MPSEKRRDMDDTWAPEELHKSLKGRDDKKRSSTRDKDKDRERRKDDDRKSRTREGDKKDKEKKERDREKDKDREKRHKERNGEEKKPRERDGERERRRRTDEEKGSSSKARDDTDRRRHRDDKDRKERDDKDRKKPREEREDRKNRDDEGKRRRHRDENGERSSKSKDDKRDRRHRDKDGNKEKRSKNEDESRHHRRRDETEEEREERRRERRRREERDRNEEKSDKEERRDRQDRHERSRDRLRTDQIDSDEDSEKKKSSKKKEEEPKQGDDGDDYDDDFEDYDDDFEDDDEDDASEAGSGKDEDNDGPVNNKPNDKSREEMDEILKAMNEENDRLMKESRRPRRREVENEEEEGGKQKGGRPTTASRKNFINFKNAKERQVTSKAVGKAARRGRELLQIVDLDFAAFDLFDMPPVNEYELYMRTYGQSDMKQSYVQTNEDNVEREIQSEEIESTEKWTQYPPEDIRGCGGGDEEPIDPEIGPSKPVDSVRLSKFVNKVGSVMCILLEEGKSQNSSSGSMTQRKSNICVSDGFIELGQSPLLQGRNVSSSWVSPLQTHMLITVHAENTENKSAVPGKGLLCVWNLNEPSQPNKLLACEGQPKCCCFSPGGSNLAFAGMQDGSIAVWDLREEISLHKKFQHGEEEYLLRYPTYNTAHVMSNSSHLSAVVSVAPIAAVGESAMGSLDLNSDGDIEGSSSFQIASLEENSKIHLWVAAELSQPDLAGSESDLGLLPGGKIKLLHSSTIILESPSRELKLKSTMQSFDMVLNPKDPSHYYVATDTGCIIHGVRYGGKAPPRAYKGDQDVPLKVTSLDFSPFSKPVFLAGCADGSLRLYSTKTETPIISWQNATEGRPIKCVCWCKSRPSVFFVLDDSSNLQIWDLNMSDSGPLKEEKVSDERVTSFVFTNDHSASGLGIPGRKPYVIVCLESGSVEVHTVSKQFSTMMPEEIDQFSAFIESVM